ncbi:MAG TPA: LOG family protein [Solimonas sp.]|nr:LOG family protein [Solimonas sp.]
MQLVKAYKNPEFLLSEDARTVRILCEYLEPKRRFRKLGIRNAVIFFGSARLRTSPLARDYFATAADFAEQLAAWTRGAHPPGERYAICTGGGPGIMEAVHEGAARVDRSLNIGLNISLPFEQHINPHVEPENAFEFHYFFMRKFWFLNLARGAVIFPGGFGTMDELFELLTLTQTGKSSPMPIVLFGKDFWESMVNFRGLADWGLISEADLQLFKLCDTVEEAMDFLRAELKPKTG